MLSEKQFYEIKNILSYEVYLCKLASEIHTKASGSLFSKNTRDLESIFLHLRDSIKAKSIDEVFTFIKDVTEVELFDGWLSPGFMVLFEINE